jgi:catechol 2,3-dioxygenase-like lactoylglutathione lyase family enzyme
MTIQRMDHVGVVVNDLDAAKEFFVVLGMEVLGESSVEGDWVDRVVGLDDVRVDVAFVQTPDGHSKLELTRFHHPPASTAEPDAPPNTVGLRRLMFAVDDIDAVVDRLRAHGADLIGEVARFDGPSAADGGSRASYRLCYVRGPEGIIVALAQQVC